MLQASKGEKMTQEDHEALTERIDEIAERVTHHRQAIGFISDHVKDDQLMSNLMMIEQGMQKTESMLSFLQGARS